MWAASVGILTSYTLDRPPRAFSPKTAARVPKKRLTRDVPRLRSAAASTRCWLAILSTAIAPPHGEKTARGSDATRHRADFRFHECWSRVSPIHLFQYEILWFRLSTHSSPPRRRAKVSSYLLGNVLAGIALIASDRGLSYRRPKERETFTSRDST